MHVVFRVEIHLYVPTAKDVRKKTRPQKNVIWSTFFFKKMKNKIQINPFQFIFGL